MAFPSLTVSEVRAFSKELQERGMKLPKMGYAIRLADGRDLVHDQRGYFLATSPDWRPPRANKSKWPTEDDERENPAGYGVKPDEKKPKTLTYGKMPGFREFNHAFDDLTEDNDFVYTIKLGRTDAKAAEGTYITDGQLKTAELYEGVQQLIKKWKKGNEAAGDLASGILITLGFEWV